MAALVKVFTAIVRIAFIVVGYMLAGPVGAFIGSIIGSMVAGAIEGLLISKSTNTEISKVNVRLAEPVRWMSAGRVKTGGAVVFAEFAADGDLWMIVVHSDTILHNRYKIFLDEIEVTVDGTGAVQTKDFRLTSKNEEVTSDGAGQTHIWVWTATYTQTNPVPPFPSSDFLTAFTQWTSDHKLTGTTYSVVHMLGMKTEDRYKMFKWRGPLGLGEPSVSIIGDYGLAYDPRDGTQTLGDKTTYKFTRNPALIWAWWRTQTYGRSKSESNINWDRIAEQADICDQTVTGISGTHVRYQCGCAFPEDRDRGECEQSILATMDGEIVFDNDGRYWARAGYYYTPTVSLYRNRDIMAMESVEALNGESESQGVIVRYTDPDSKYTIQPSAAWINPLYYQPGTSATFLSVEIPEIQDHNQAMRIAKAIGLRQAPPHKLAPTTGLRGLKAVRERIVNLQYDNTFSGDYEVCTQVEIDSAGVLTQFGVVPVDADRWSLLAGEEKAKPVSTSTTFTPAFGSIGTVTYTYTDGRINASFTPSSNASKVEFQYIKTADIGTDAWIDMTVQQFDGKAFTDQVTEGVSYSFRYRLRYAVTAQAWSTVTTYTPATTIGPVTDLAAAGGVGSATVTWRNPNSAAFHDVDVFRNTTNNFGTATLIASAQVGGLGQSQSKVDTTTTGLKYYWVRARANDGTLSTVAGPVTATIT